MNKKKLLSLMLLAFCAHSFADGMPSDVESIGQGKIVGVKKVGNKLLKIRESERKLLLEPQPKAQDPKPVARSKQSDTTISTVAPGEIAVSDSDVNRIVFQSPVVKAIFPTDIAEDFMARKPIYLSNNTEVALQFKPGATRSIQGLFELENGEVKTLYFRPIPIRGIVYRVSPSNGADLAKAEGLVRSGSDNAQIESDLSQGEISLHKALVSGKVPAGFYEIKPYGSLQFDRFTVQSVKAYEGKGKRINVYKLIARDGVSSTVTPPMFQRSGVTSVLIDGDQVDATHSPLVIVIEDHKES